MFRHSVNPMLEIKALQNIDLEVTSRRLY